MKTTFNFFTISLLVIFFFSCKESIDTNNLSVNENIRINQIGYYPESPKIVVFADIDAENFVVIDTTGKVVFDGELTDKGKWELSGENIKTGDFSSLKSVGKYRIVIKNIGKSYPFEIKNQLYDQVFLDAAKSFYYQRCSAPIKKKYAGKYARPSSFPDDTVYYHPSTGKAKGFISSPGGWFDAGDYGKYIVNAGISVSTMLLYHSIHPVKAADNSLNIPESGNDRNDLLDELKYELDWMFTMQDKDGGVFHKVTTLQFTPFKMPHEINKKRYVIGKPASATLDFATTMALAYQAFLPIDSVYANKALNAAKRAWSWAINNDTNFYKQNPDDVNTGPYNDDDLTHEFFWAAAGLYCATQQKTYEKYLNENWVNLEMIPEESWSNYVSNIGFYSLVTYLDENNPFFQKAQQSMIQLADKECKRLSENPYLQPLEIFSWGSNSDVLNYAVVFAVAHHLTNNDKYLDAMIKTVDFIFGKNPTAYCYVTGYGDKQVKNIHHRVFASDNIDQLPPGFVVGGANGNMEDKGYLEQNNLQYKSQYPAKAYLDVTESFASNEICLNWNAPFVFSMGYLSQVYNK